MTKNNAARRLWLALGLMIVCSPQAHAAELPGADALRAAIVDLAETFPDEYTQADAYLQRLTALEGRPATDETLAADFNALKKEALTANPLIARQPILFIERNQYKKDHHNTATMFQTAEINTGSFNRSGSSVRTIDFARDGQVNVLLDVPEGVVRDPDVRFDGRRVLVSLRNSIEDDYHLYELNADGSELAQLTFGSGISDIDPIYLPSGQLMMTSTREPKFCMCNRHIMGNLFTLNADGSNIQQVGHSTLHEGHPAVMPDGRILYDRWEYVDRNFGDAQGVWTVNPDGTNHAVYYGNNTNSPGGVLDNRIIPGTDLLICTFSSCHDLPWGAIAIVDRRLGIDGKPPVVRTWPADSIDLVEVGNYDTFVKLKQKFEDPWALSDKYFLASGMFGSGSRMGIWLLDMFGNELLLHTTETGCFDPMPLGARTRPPAIPSRVDLAQSDGTFYIRDCYQGTGMETVEPGSIKFLRVVESPEKRFWTQPAWNGSGTQAPGMAWDDFNNKRILGTVPVDEDGSAYFSVPADTFVYFQLLDERGMMIQSMRSGTIVRPGEQAGCVGCHDSRLGTVPPAAMPSATGRKADRLEPWRGPARNFGYVAEVQHVFDKHCVSCHDYGQDAGAKLNLAGDFGLSFNTSYVELRSKNFIRVVGAGPFRTQLPMTWGSHASPLARVMRDGHKDPTLDEGIHLSDEDFDRVVTWIDLNGPYYPEYASAYRGNLYGRSPINGAQLGRLAELTGLNLNDQKFSAMVSFSRPELSPCLKKFPGSDTAEYQEALAIINSGHQALAATPRADMPGFVLVDRIEIDQQTKYDARLEAEARMREAILDGEKTYETSDTSGD